MLRLCICGLFFALFIEKARSGGIVEVRFVRYDNPDGEGDNGNPCDGLMGISRSECDQFFQICLDTQTSSDESMDTCPFGFKETAYIHNQNSFDFNRTNIGGSTPNPLKFPFTQWPTVGMRIKIDVNDDDSSNDNDHVELLPPQTIPGSPDSSESEALEQVIVFSGRTTLETEVRVYCDKDWYGRNCETNCVPRSSSLDGYYNCGSDGSRRCHAGWEGYNCNVNINECNSFPCYNDGTCTDQVNGYTCECPAAFTGGQCDTEVNNCVGFCINDGVCVSSADGPICHCPTGFSGATCEMPVDPCVTSQCGNGGSCISSGDNYTCDCLTGFTGSNCELDVVECEDDPCVNGVCENLFGSFRCTCDAGFTGALCDINPCNNTDCENGGTCSPLGSGGRPYECICAVGFMGDHCEFELNDLPTTILPEEATEDEKYVTTVDYSLYPCMSSPCKNGATCAKARGDWADPFFCTCATGYIGSTCDTLENNCESNPCENLGTCENHVGSYSCQCRNGWSGPNCNRDIDECLDEEFCANGGSCTNRIGSFRCRCAPGFTGDRCLEREPCPCENSGACTFTSDGVTCTCPGLWTGDRCEISPCINKPCKNEGVCRVTNDEFMCKCPAGYTGDLCESEKDECQLEPCQNGGVCEDGLNSYTCSCPIGFSGLKCEKQNPPHFFMFEGHLNDSDLNTLNTNIVDHIANRITVNQGEGGLTLKSNYNLCKNYKGQQLVIYEFQVQDANNELVPNEVVEAVRSQMIADDEMPLKLHDGSGCGNSDVNIAESKQNDDVMYGEHDQWRAILGVVVGCLCVVLVALIVGLALYMKDRNPKSAGYAATNPTFKYRDDPAYTNMRGSGGRAPRSFRCYSGDYTSTKVDIGED